MLFRQISLSSQAVLLLVATCACTAHAQTTSKVAWGISAKGEAVDLYRVTNGRAELDVSNFGARIVGLRLPDRHNVIANVVLSAASPVDFTGFMSVSGATMGRYANRIARGHLDLDGLTYHLQTNNHGNTLHGGSDGFNQQIWKGTAVAGGVRMELISPDGDVGFPGTLRVAVTFLLKRRGSAYELEIRYRATTTKTTVINLTNHAFFNLANDSSESVLRDVAMIDADRFLAEGPNGLPDGTELPVKGSALDFRTPRPIGDRIPAKGDDAALVLRHADVRVRAARIEDPVSGRTLEVYTSEPSIQLFVPRPGVPVPQAASEAKNEPARFAEAFSLETEHFPDSPNHAAFPSTTLRPGQKFTSVTRYSFSNAP